MKNSLWKFSKRNNKNSNTETEGKEGNANYSVYLLFNLFPIFYYLNELFSLAWLDSEVKIHEIRKYSLKKKMHQNY